VLVTLLSEDGVPLAAWLFMKAFPVRWATSDLNAEERAVVIDTLELAYGRMQSCAFEPIMPVEIRELVIRAVVADDEAAVGLGRGGAGRRGRADVQAIVDECVRQVLRILRRQEER
jgi:hypothetical protein